MNHQLELTDLSKKKNRKRVAPECARKMMAILASNSSWVNRSEIMKMYNWKDSRPCRVGRKGSHGRIIFGQSGFKLTRLSTLKEIDTCLATILSQIQALQDEYRQLLNRRHSHETT